MRLTRPLVLLAVVGVTISCSRPDQPTEPRFVRWGEIDPGTSGPVGCNGGGDQIRSGEEGVGSVVQSQASLVVGTYNCSAQLELQCSAGAQVNWGQGVTCQVVVEPAGFPISIAEWGFDGPDGYVIDPGYTGVSWSGPMIQSGMVRVEVDADGGRTPLSRYIMVAARPQASWSIVTQQGAPGEIDSCFDADGLGATRRLGCTQADAQRLFTPAYPGAASHSPAYISSGPNKGLWYVGWPGFATINLRTQVLRDLRPDAIPQTVGAGSDPVVVGGCTNYDGSLGTRTIFEVNTYCAPNAAYNSLVAFIWAHEQRHMDAARQSALAAENNLPQLLSPLTARSSAQLQVLVSNVFESVHFRVAKAAESTHLPGSTTFTIWAPAPTPTWTSVPVPAQN